MSTAKLLAGWTDGHSDSNNQSHGPQTLTVNGNRTENVGSNVAGTCSNSDAAIIPAVSTVLYLVSKSLTSPCFS